VGSDERTLLQKSQISGDSIPEIDCESWRDKVLAKPSVFEVFYVSLLYKSSSHSEEYSIYRPPTS